MRGLVANTDREWFSFLRAVEPPLDEMNFWRPGSDVGFKALRPGEPVLFRLTSPDNAIAGFGFFAHFSLLPSMLAWEVYGAGNGAASYRQMRERLVRLRSRFDMGAGSRNDVAIGCILLTEPVFLPDHEWISSPADWAPNLVQGKRYDLDTGEGARIWGECLERAARTLRARQSAAHPGAQAPPAGYGEPLAIRPRLGPRSFRIAVLDAYGRRCTVTGERTLPALEAAHIREFADRQDHSISNGLLFRADIHKLFRTGYVTVTPDHHFEVSRRIREEFEGGRVYYRLHGAPVRLPDNPAHHPLPEALWWHNEQRYLG